MVHLASATADGWSRSASAAVEGRANVAARAGAALALFAVLAIAHTWPLATNPAHLSRNDNADTLLNTWTIAWVSHELPRDPRHLFDANIFYPERFTLAYSEAMIVQSLLAMPILALGASPVLAYNLVLMAGFALTGWAFWLLLWRWTRSAGAAYIGGSIGAFNSHVLVRLPHLQAQHVEFVALMLFALDRLVTSQRARDAVWLGIGFALEGLTSVYLLVFSTWMLLFAVPARAREWLRSRPLRMVGLFAVAAAVGLVLLAPYLAGYLALHRATGIERQPWEAAEYAATWQSYLRTGSRLHNALWSYRFDSVGGASDLFPGVTATVLALLALAWPETRRDGRVRMCAVAAAGCVLVSILPRATFYPRLHEWIPLFRAVRVVAHVGQIALLMIAVLAGFGAAGLSSRIHSVRTWTAAALALCLAVNLEALRAPLEYTPFSSIPRIYDTLAPVRNAVIAEFPFYSPHAMFANAEYMLDSTRHWRPMLNGHSGIRPDSYDETYRALSGFPDPGSLVALHDRGVTHVVVHLDRLEAGVRAALDQSESLVLVADAGDIRIYRLR